MRKLIKKTKGQVLVISVTAMFVLFVMGLAVIEIGNIVYERTHMQNIADSGAMEAGTWYARALNMVSITNKLLVLEAGVALALAIIAGPLALEAVNKVIEPTQKVQDFFAGTGSFEKIKVMPWLVEGAVIINGQRNQAASLALFNTETFKEYQLPSFNLKRRTLADVLDKEQILTRYYYVENSTGKKVVVAKNEVKTNNTGRLYQDKTGKFVIKQEGLAGENVPEEINKFMGKATELFESSPEVEAAAKLLKFDIVETGPHTVLVGSFKDKVKQKLGTNFFNDENGKALEPFMASCALARIDGGSMGFWDMDGAAYSPHLDRVQLPDLAAFFNSPDSGEFIKQAKKNTGEGSARGLNALEKIQDMMKNGVLLH